MYVQNLVGNHPRRWDRTGLVVEVRQFHQYAIRMDGSGRVTLRNRQHLRRFNPFQLTPVKLVPTLHSLPGMESSQPTNVQSTPVPATAPPPTKPTSDTTVVPSIEPTTPPTLLPPICQEQPADTSLPSEPQPVQPVARVPLSLRRLLPHNTPGIIETVPPARRQKH